jgi:2,3-bisphosphoglycerate-dependent phosphoglycerate mutase
MMGKLIIARHNESEWNHLGKWTGKRDRHLTDEGFEKSEDMGLLIKDFKIDCAFASMQVRSIETLSCMLNVCNFFEVPTEHSAALNERDYGDYTGKNKWDMEKLIGEEEFNKLRRNWDYPVPNGETLKMVSERTVPFFLDKVLPKVKEGKNVLVVAHGNSLRTLIKYIEQISDEGIADVEMPFSSIYIYDLDENGRMIHKDVRKIETPEKEKYSKAQIVATIGPSSETKEVLKAMIDNQLDVARFNFSWSDSETRIKQISLVRELAKEAGRNIPIIVDLPGARMEKDQGHTYDSHATTPLTDNDKKSIQFAIANNVEYIALSFVGGPEDVRVLRKAIEDFSGKQKIIAKIERKVALDSIDAIIAESDAVMVARGDLGNEVPLEQIPFVQESIIKKCKEAGKPVITATQMLLSMVESPTPERAEVSDVTNAILQGSDAVMLSEETAKGKYPVEAVAMMEKIIVEAEQHESSLCSVNSL